MNLGAGSVTAVIFESPWEWRSSMGSHSVLLILVTWNDFTSSRMDSLIGNSSLSPNSDAASRGIQFRKSLWFSRSNVSNRRVPFAAGWNFSTFGEHSKCLRFWNPPSSRRSTWERNMLETLYDRVHEFVGINSFWRDNKLMINSQQCLPQSRQ